MGKTSRRKGSAWQAELARRWRDSGLFPGAQSTQGEQVRTLRGCTAYRPPDVEGTPLAVEAKHEKRANPIAALKQAEAEADARGDTRPAVAVVRPHGSGPDGAVVVMRLPVFELLAEAAQGGFTMADLVEARKRTREREVPRAVEIPTCPVCGRDVGEVTLDGRIATCAGALHRWWMADRRPYEPETRTGTGIIIPGEAAE